MGKRDPKIQGMTAEIGAADERHKGAEARVGTAEAIPTGEETTKEEGSNSRNEKTSLVASLMCKAANRNISPPTAPLRRPCP